MDQKETSEYIVNNTDKFKVLAVSADLVGIVKGEKLEEYLKKAIQRVYETNDEPTLKDVGEVLGQAGFGLKKHIASEIYGMDETIELEMDLNIWMRFYIEVISVLFEGSVSWVIEHVDTKERVYNKNKNDILSIHRERFGINPDRSAEDELERIFAS